MNISKFFLKNSLEKEALKKQVDRLEEVITAFQKTRNAETLREQIDRLEVLANEDTESARDLIKKFNEMTDAFQEKVQSTELELQTELSEIKNQIRTLSEEKDKQKDKKVKLPSRRRDLLATIALIVLVVINTVYKICNESLIIENNTEIMKYFGLVSALFEAVISEEVVFHTGLLAKYEKYSWYGWLTRGIYIGICVIGIVAIIGFYISQCPLPDAGEMILSVIAIILSGISFTIAFCANYKEYSLKSKRGKS